MYPVSLAALPELLLSLTRVTANICLTCSYLLMLTIPGWLRAVTLQSSSAKVVHLVFWQRHGMTFCSCC